MIRRFFGLVIGLVASMFACAAHADQRAEFAPPGREPRFSIEISDSGAVRVSSDFGGYYLIKEGRAYEVRPGPGGPRVIEFDAVVYQARRMRAKGKVIPLDRELKSPAGYNYLEGGPATVRGRAGTNFRLEGFPNAPPLTVSDDSQLRPMGRALSQYLALVDRLQFDREISTNRTEVLKDKGVLRFWDQELVSIDNSPIDPARFRVPAGAPVTLADVIAEDEQTSANPESEERPAIVSGTFLAKELFTLDRAGTLSQWSEGGDTGQPLKGFRELARFCATTDELWLLEIGNKSSAVVWSGKPGAWLRRGTLNSAKDGNVLAMDCSGDEPLVLTATAVRLLRSGRSVPVASKVRQWGYTVTLQHGGYLYVGINAGEWGGGLHRFPLSGGAGQLLDASNPTDLCAGALNAACAPVTGLAPDPARPDCILASSGLVHFFSRGSVVRVCDGVISTAYEKPYTTEEGWKFDPAHPASEGDMTVPFYSLAAGRSGTWAVGSDGYYQFSEESVPHFTAFENGRRMVSKQIDWSNQDFVLISTNMNQSHSLSGSSLILVPR